MRLRRGLAVLLLVWAVMPLRAEAGDSAAATAPATAVSLDGRPTEGPQPTAYAWKILEGEGGSLFQIDREDAVFWEYSL